MKGIRVELLKLAKTKYIIVFFIIYILIVISLLYNKLIDTKSGVYDLNLSHPYQISSLFLLVFIMYSNIYGILIGSYFGASEYENKTWSLLLNKYTIGRVITNKLVSFIVISILLPVFIVMIGLIAGFFFREASLDDFGLGMLIIQLLTAILTFIVIGLFALFISFLLKSTSAGNTIGLLIMVISLFFGSVFNLLNFISPQWYILPFYEKIFTNLNGSAGIEIISTNTLPVYVNMSITIIAFTMAIYILYMIGNRREFD